MTPLPLPTTMVLADHHTVPERIEKLCKAIENEHNCNAKHAGSVESNLRGATQICAVLQQNNGAP